MNKLPQPLAFNWDQGNQDKNWHTHQVTAKEAEQVFFNQPIHLLKDIKQSQKEDRFIALGVTDKKCQLHLVYTVIKSKIRIISARNQSKKERMLYGEKPK